MGTRTWKIEAKFFKMQSISIDAMRNNRETQTVSVQLFSLNKLHHNFWISIDVKIYFSIFKVWQSSVTELL